MAEGSAARERPLPNSASSRRLETLYRRLVYWYGSQHWWPAADPFEVMVGAVLTQSTSWTNVEKAIARLEGAGALSPAAVHQMNLADLEELIRPSGYYRTKARKLKALASHLVTRYGGAVQALQARPTPSLRQELLTIFGIGPETADAILLYALHRPVFVVDAYTLRAGVRLGLFPAGTRYAEAQAFFTDHLPLQTRLFNEFHALWVLLGKDACRKRPVCRVCPLQQLCPTGQGEPLQASESF